MTTNEIFKKIYKDLKEEMQSNKGEIFIKEYEIPSINYNENNITEDMYFISGIEMEIDKIMQCFENKVHYSNYKDKYFFSNDIKKVREKLSLEVQNDKTELGKLKENLERKIDNEYENLIAELKECEPQVIIERAYEKVSKEEMIDKIKEKDYTIEELKILLKTDGILQQCYDEWLESDGGFNQILEDSVDERINFIIQDYTKENKHKDIESR